MSKPLDTKLRFIELRGNGFSYSRIAKDLGVSKTTLIEWGKDEDTSKHIQNLEALYKEEMIENCGMNIRKRLERLSKLQNKLYSELNDRDLSTIPTDKLLVQVYKLDEILSNSIGQEVVLQDAQLFDSLTTWHQRVS